MHLQSLLQRNRRNQQTSILWPCTLSCTSTPEQHTCYFGSLLCMPLLLTLGLVKTHTVAMHIMMQIPEQHTCWFGSLLCKPFLLSLGLISGQVGNAHCHACNPSTVCCLGSLLGEPFLLAAEPRLFAYLAMHNAMHIVMHILMLTILRRRTCWFSSLLSEPFLLTLRLVNAQAASTKSLPTHVAGIDLGAPHSLGLYPCPSPCSCCTP